MRHNIGYQGHVKNSYRSLYPIVGIMVYVKVQMYVGRRNYIAVQCVTE